MSPGSQLAALARARDRAAVPGRGLPSPCQSQESNFRSAAVGPREKRPRIIDIELALLVDRSCRGARDAWYLQGVKQVFMKGKVKIVNIIPRSLDGPLGRDEHAMSQTHLDVRQPRGVSVESKLLYS